MAPGVVAWRAAGAAGTQNAPDSFMVHKGRTVGPWRGDEMAMRRRRRRLRREIAHAAPPAEFGATDGNSIRDMQGTVSRRKLWMCLEPARKG